MGCGCGCTESTNKKNKSSMLVSSSNSLNNKVRFTGSKQIDFEILNNVIRSGNPCPPTNRDTICPDAIPEITLFSSTDYLSESNHVTSTHFGRRYLWDFNDQAYKGSDLVKYNNVITSQNSNYTLFISRIPAEDNPGIESMGNVSVDDFAGADDAYATAAAFAGANAGDVSEDNPVGVVGNVDY